MTTKKNTSVLKKAKAVAGKVMTGAAKGAAIGALSVVSDAVGVEKDSKTSKRKDTGGSQKATSKSATKTKSKPGSKTKESAKSKSGK